MSRLSVTDMEAILKWYELQRPSRDSSSDQHWVDPVMKRIRQRVEVAQQNPSGSMSSFRKNHAVASKTLAR